MNRVLHVVAICLICLSTGSFAQTSPLPPPAHPVTRSQVEQLFAVTHMLDHLNKMMEPQMDAGRKQFPFFPEVFWTEMAAEFKKVDWIGLATPVYQKYLSEEDADKVIAFYKTDAGQRALEASFGVSTELMEKGRDLGAEIGKRVADRHKAEIEESIKKYQETHPTPAQ